MLKSRDYHCQGGEKYGVCSYSEMQRGLQKQQEEQLVQCGRGHCVLVSKLVIKLHFAIVSPIGVDAFECKICINLVSPYRAVDLGITLG